MRRFFRFGLRTFLGLVIAIAILMGYARYRFLETRKQIATELRLHQIGVSVWYEGELADGNSVIEIDEENAEVPGRPYTHRLLEIWQKFFRPAVIGADISAEFPSSVFGDTPNDDVTKQRCRETIDAFRGFSKLRRLNVHFGSCGGAGAPRDFLIAVDREFPKIEVYSRRDLMLIMTPQHEWQLYKPSDTTANAPSMSE